LTADETVTQVIEEVKMQICDHYCKYAAGCVEEEEFEKLWEERCGKECPLNRL